MIGNSALRKTTHTATARPAIRLRVYRDYDGGHGLDDPKKPSLDWTVRQFLDAFVMPHYLVAKKRQPGTVRLFYQTVKLWEELTENPTIRIIERQPESCQDWVEALKQRPGLDSEFIADNTVRKLCTHFQKILDLMGPRSRRNRNAVGLISEVPYLERPELVRESPDGDFTLEEIEQWLRACHHAPQAANLGKIAAAKFHQKLILFTYNTSLRIDSVMSATWDMVDKKRPGWITIPARIYKGRKYGGDFYLNRFAREAIEALRQPGQKSLFPWRGWPKSQSWLQTQRRRLLEKTEIPAERRFGYHGLRGACLTWLAERNPMVAKIVGGHRGGVTQEHYVNPRIVASLLEKLPQPRVADPQKFLF